MDVPPIRYVQTSDGVSLAYSSAGVGPQLLVVGGWTNTSHIELEVRDENPLARIVARLAENFELVRYDFRGSGLSERHPEHITLESLLLDLDAVMEAVGRGPVTLLGLTLGGTVAAAYAARHPERVASMILYGATANGTSLSDPAVQASMRDLMASSWSGASRAFTAWFAPDGSDDADFGGRLTRLMVSGMDGETGARIYDLQHAVDVRDELSKIEAPTMVLHRRRDRVIPLEHGKQLAAAIAGAQLVILDGSNHVPASAREADEVVDAIEQFLGAVPGHDVAAEPEPTVSVGGFQTILFTDLESSTALTQRLGDEAAQELLRGHNTAVRGALEANGGREVKHTGDGIMAAFPSAVSAVQAGLQIQREMAGGEVRVRVGINAGEPIAEDGDFFGTAVQLAARITDRAEPGQVLVSNVVRELCAGKTFEFTSQGDATLKGFDEPVTLYEVRA